MTVESLMERVALKLWGLPQSIDPATALVALGMRSEIHPDDVWAYRVPNTLVAVISSHLNLKKNGHPTLGRYRGDGGVIVVLDLRPMLVEMDTAPTDPALPDHHLSR